MTSKIKAGQKPAIRAPRSPKVDSHAAGDPDLPETGASAEDFSPSRDGETRGGDGSALGAAFQRSDERLRRSQDEQRRARAAEDSLRNEDDGLESTMAERLRFWNDEWTESALPKLPTIPGYYLCWLSTTHRHDPIQRRMRMGYTAVKPEELPQGFEYLTQKSGEWTGFLGINEMLLFKLPMELYEAVMTQLHHDAPLDEERGVRERSMQFADSTRDRTGQSLVSIEEGMNRLGARPRLKPTFQG